ncbi:MAG: hypothetical protein MI810_15140 [Flavobacteriales bacterium]|nr:hypothetical protein [Flavobacteriales bacterium]
MLRIAPLILLSFLLFSTASLSQQKSIKFDKLSIEDGLSQSSVSAILQDRYGFIWIATQDGLNRYDGYEFKTFKNDPNNLNSIPNNYIHNLLEDKEGNLWFGTNRGIGKLNPLTHRIEKVNRGTFPALRGYVFIDLAFDSQGHLLALSDKHGINKINLKTKKVDIIKSIKGNFEFSALHIDANGELWVGTKTGHVYHAPPPYEHFQHINYNDIFSVSAINKISTGGNGYILVSSENGLYTIDENYRLNTISMHPYLRVNNIRCAYVEDSAHTWIGTAEHGLLLLQKNKKGKESVYQYKKNPYDASSITDDEVKTIYEDQSGVFWLGTGKGISKFDKYKQGFTTVSLNNDPKKGLIDYSVWSFAEDSLGNIYVGTQKDLTIYDPRRKRFHHIFRDRNEQSRLLKIHIENPRRIWLGYEDGLYLLTIRDLINEDYSFEKIPFLGEENDRKVIVYQIEPAEDNNLWIGSKAGLSILNKNTLECTFYKASDGGHQSIGEGSVKNIYRDLSGKVWIVTSDQGLYNIIEKVDGTFYFRHIPIINHTESNSHITCILQTEKNNLWLGTYGEGIKLLNLRSKRTINYTETEGLSNNVVYGLLEDSEGNIWASTNKGISKFNPKTERFTTYGVRDGLQSNEFNTNAYMKSRSGKLYFGGINGYNIFNPKEININPHPPNVIISSVVLTPKGLGEKEIIISNVYDSVSLDLNYDQNDLSFEFFATNFSNPGKNRFKFILKGHEENYTYVENENKVHYILPHGNYIFEIYAQSADGVWSKRPAIVTVNINPPFWLTWWFRIVAIVLLTAASLFIYRRRVDTIRRQKVRLEIEVVKRTRQVTEQNKKIQDQKQKVEIQKAKIEHQKELLENEKEKVEQLLLNILPEGTAEELKNKGRSKARYYRNVSVLFTDFVGFSKIAEDMKPQELVQQLDGYFSKFDEIIEKYDLEKIKTIGDSYMCAGGVPIRNKSNAIEVTLAALEIKNYMLEREQEDKEKGKNSWKIRIGINTGEVIAGVIGLKRFAYDIWGATVNQAQRMEMHGQPGTVNVSGNTYEYIAPYFECTYRGKIQTKHKGMLDMFYVKGIKPELSENGEGKIPNPKFWKIVDLHLYSAINYMKAERHIMKILETQLSPKLLYHSINHTIDVTKAVERLAIMEGITDEDLFLLKSAATYHDAGFIEKYDKNEEIGMRLAREILPKYGYTQEQIDVIDGLIKATEIPQSPKTHLQEIMCDADLDYLGRDDFHDIASLLRRELREHGKLDSDKAWDEIQLKFLNQHTYFTKSAIKLRQEKKEKHIKEIEEKLNTYQYKD